MLKPIKVLILVAFFISLCGCDNSQTDSNKSSKKHPDAIGEMLKNSSHDITNHTLNGDPIKDPFGGK